MLPEYEEWFDRLYRENFWILKRYARIHLNSTQAEELVQDVFHDALKKLDIIYAHSNPGGWLMETLKNKIRNMQRTNQRDLLRLVSLDSEDVQQISEAETSESVIEQAENSRSIKEMLDATLSNEEKYILRRLIFEKASHKELAKELGITVWSSQKKLERIRNKLDQLFPGHRRKK